MWGSFGSQIGQLAGGLHLHNHESDHNKVIIGMHDSRRPRHTHTPRALQQQRFLHPQQSSADSPYVQGRELSPQPTYPPQKTNKPTPPPKKKPPAKYIHLSLQHPPTHSTSTHHPGNSTTNTPPPHQPANKPQKSSPPSRRRLVLNLIRNVLETLINSSYERSSPENIEGPPPPPTKAYKTKIYTYKYKKATQYKYESLLYRIIWLNSFSRQEVKSVCVAKYTNFFKQRVPFRGRIFIDTYCGLTPAIDLEETTSPEGLPL